jgi:hypothetical protein
MRDLRRENFLICIRRNPLKSLDSEKQALVNASYFTSAYSRLLTLIGFYWGLFERTRLAQPNRVLKPALRPARRFIPLKKPGRSRECEDAKS